MTYSFWVGMTSIRSGRVRPASLLLIFAAALASAPAMALNPPVVQATSITIGANPATGDTVGVIPATNNPTAWALGTGGNYYFTVSAVAGGGKLRVGAHIPLPGAKISFSALARNAAGTGTGNVVVTVATATPVNGLCGSANLTTVSTAPTSSSLCNAGAASGVSGSGPWTWTCVGSGGGTTAKCSASLQPPPASSSLPSGVTLTAIDGETLTGTTNTLTYFSGKNALGTTFNSNSAWLNNQFIVGTWMENPGANPQALAYDVAMGNNLLVNPAGGSAVDYAAIRTSGLHAIASNKTANTGSETVGWFGTDEVDLATGDGWGGWSQSSGCTSSTSCGNTEVNFYYAGSANLASGTLAYPIDGRVIWNGYGKGVLEFESGPGSGFTRPGPFLKFSDINAADVYWFTDTYAYRDFWGACQVFWDNPSAAPCANGAGPGLTAAAAALAANYEANITVLRHIQQVNGLGLNGSKTKPIFGYVEVACPMTNGLCVTAAQFTAAAWHEIIAGARGIVWFQHSFSGPCVDYNTLYDGSYASSLNKLYNCLITGNTHGTAASDTGSQTLAQLVAAVTKVNSQINALSPVLLSPSANGYVNTTGTVSTMTKYYNSKFYIIAGSGKPGIVPAAN